MDSQRKGTVNIQTCFWGEEKPTQIKKKYTPPSPPPCTLSCLLGIHKYNNEDRIQQHDRVAKVDF
jgi:hypothetical protein